MTESIETLEASAQNRAFAQSDRAYALGLPGKVRNAHIVSAVIRRGQPRLRNTAARISRPITLGPIGPDCVTDRRLRDTNRVHHTATVSVDAENGSSIDERHLGDAPVTRAAEHSQSAGPRITPATKRSERTGRRRYRVRLRPGLTADSGAYSPRSSRRISITFSAN
jgi:hypothetical protein